MHEVVGSSGRYVNKTVSGRTGREGSVCDRTGGGGGGGGG